jgi:putative hydrolase of the HAD superfamily
MALARMSVPIMNRMAQSVIRAVAFDAVGTLLHPNPPAAEVYAALGRRYGSRLALDDIRSRFRAACAAQEQFDIECGLVTSEERELRRWQQIVAIVLDDVTDPLACFAELYAHFAQPEAWRSEPGTAQLLARLRGNGYALALASNYDHRLRRVVAGITDLAPITAVVISSEIGWRKPAAQFFAHIGASLRLPAHCVLHVGDDFANDFEGARDAGMQAVLFDPHRQRPGLGSDRINDLAELQLPQI